MLGSIATLVRRTAIAAVAGAAIGAGALALLRHRLLRRPLPQTAGTISLQGLSDTVEIARDRWGVPHVTARSREDLWFGQGFCHGQDRLWQMDFYRRITAGGLSEIAGEEGLPVDRLMLTLGLRRVAEREQAELDPGLRRELDAFCAGVNAAAAQAKAK